MARKHISFLIVYGPEVRAFVHSGLMKRLSEKYDVSIITTHPESDVFENVDYASIHKMPNVSENRWLARLRIWSGQSQKAWLRKNDFATWRHLLPPEDRPNLRTHKHLWHSIIDHAIWFHVLPVLERRAARFLGDQAVWHRLFCELNVSCLVAASLKGGTILPALQTARRMGIKLVGATHSWKDVYVRSYISLVPDHIVMVSTTSADYMMAVNPHISPNKISVSTSLHFEKILNPERILTRQEFCTKVGLDWQRPYICYTAANPRAVLGELDVIRALISAMENHQNPPQILLRINPMDDGSQFSVLQEEYPSVLILQQPNWEWTYGEDWCSPLEDDVILWANTIYHSACNVSIPSTVTMEFAALKKPVINVCFDLVENIPEERSISRFWNAPFYEEVRQSDYAIPTFSREELDIALQRVMDNSFEIPRCPFFPSQSPVEHMLSQIESMLDNN